VGFEATRAATRYAALIGAVACLAAGVAEAAPKKNPARKKALPPPSAVWHVETPEGTVVDSNSGDLPINPASVTKVATTLWALEELGPGRRFTTRFLARGGFDRGTGVLTGDLLVEGGGDPDFHAENAFLVLAELGRLGLRRVTGDLVVDHWFWTGWEGGSEGRISDADQRALAMGQRLQRTLDTRRWSKRTRQEWDRIAKLEGLPAKPPALQILGTVRVVERLPEPTEELALHRSRPLVHTLRMFNAYSNNDIERIADHLGRGSDLAAWLCQRWQLPPGTIQFETTSGLGVNRISPRLIVHLLRDISFTAERLGLTLDEVLPVVGCDPGTVANFFPRLGSGAYAAAVVGKTGTLVVTDGGVSVFAGVARTAAGENLFAVAVPRAGGRLRAARRVEEDFVLSLLDRLGGPETRICAEPLPGRMDEIRVERTARAAAAAAPGLPAALRSSRGAAAQ